MRRKHSGPKISLSAHAKINLYLFVGSREPSGFHQLETLFQEISLHDQLTFERTEGPIELHVNSGDVPAGPDNLVVKALRLLKKKMGTRYGMRVHLRKNIPVGAGLGGGSSDAAAALRAGWRLWSRSTTKTVPDILFSCAKKLGADVSFFLHGGRALAGGYGEKLMPLPRGGKRWLVLIYPRVAVSTAFAYKELDRFRSKKRRGHVEQENSFNSFEPVILPRFPGIAKAHRTLQTLGCESVLMSGSGSAVFGFPKSLAEAKKIKRKLKNTPWDTYLTHTR